MFMLRGCAIALVTIVLTGCSQQQAGGGWSPPPMPVETAVVTPATFEDRFDAVGTVEAHEAVRIVSEIDALVRELPFTEGSNIAKGTLIAQLDDVQLRAEQARAMAMRDQAKITYDRIKSLFDKGAIPQQEFDDAEAGLKVAEAELAMLEARLAKTRIVAPFDGAVGARRVSPGAFLRAGTQITDLAQIAKLKIMFAAPERFFPQMKRGAEVQVSTTAYPDYVLTGKIEVIEPQIDPVTRSARMIAHVNNPGLKFRPGMSANVTAVLARRDQALMVPDEAVFAEGNQILVFVVKPDSTVARTPITIGSRQRESVEVLSGLEAGAQVVRAGHQKLFEGAKVMPVLSSGGAPQTSAGTAP